VAECTKLNGYFIATCYDGRTIFNKLKKKLEGESSDIYVDNKKIWSVTKMYDATNFEDDESSLGYKIDVYQDSINQTISEYLVNFDFLVLTMEKYGFNLITQDEARQMKLPSGSGMFSDLYNAMNYEIKKDPAKKADYKDAPNMNDYEKNISFLNRYFVFKKVSTRNAENLTNVLLNQLPNELEFEEKGTELARESVKQTTEIIKPKAKMLKDKLNLREATEALEEQPNVENKDNVVEDNVVENNVKEDNADEDKIIITEPPKKKRTRKNRDKN
jgi:hypothetical protein